jgi:hypothetical protein
MVGAPEWSWMLVSHNTRIRSAEQPAVPRRSVGVNDVVVRNSVAKS